MKLSLDCWRINFENSLLLCNKILYNKYVSEIVNLEEMIPEDHFLRLIETHFDWDFVYEEVENYILKLDVKVLTL